MIDIEWNDKFNSFYNWYEINDLIAESEWDLVPDDLLIFYVNSHKDKIDNHIWTNKVHNTLKKASQTYNYKYGFFDFRDKNQKCKVVLYKNPNKIDVSKNKFWLICNEKVDFIKKYNSLEDAQDDLFITSQKREDDLFLLETKNFK